MQVLIVGDFRSGSGASRFAGEEFNEINSSDNIVFCKDTSLALEEIAAGLIADIVICSTGVDMDVLAANFVKHGSGLPKMLQSDSSDSVNQQGISRKYNSSAWIGDESEPLRLGQSLLEMEKSLILQTLTHCGGNRTFAADILGISSRTLRSKLQQYSAEGCTVAAPRPRHAQYSEYAPMTGKLLS